MKKNLKQLENKLFYIKSRLKNLFKIFKRYFIKKTDTESIKKKEGELLQAISQLIYFYINKEDENKNRNIENFIRTCFELFRKKSPNEVVVYPYEFYDLIFRINENVCRTKIKTLSTINNSSQLYLFFDDKYNTKLSEETYSTIWNCLRNQIEYGADEMVLQYWKYANDHFIYRLKRKYNKEDNNLEKEIFLEFHFALGALLMYEKKYKLLSILMKHADSFPASYYLVPETMDEVIKRYSNIKEPQKDPWYFLKRYPFPRSEGVGYEKNSLIKTWAEKYLAVLFLRQFTIENYYNGELTLYLSNSFYKNNKIFEYDLEDLKKHVEQLLNDKPLLAEIGFPDFQKKWFEVTKKPRPWNLIDLFIKELNENIERQEVSVDLVKNFKEKTKEIFLETEKQYEPIWNKTEFESENNFKLNRLKYLDLNIDKSNFSDNQNQDNKRYDYSHFGNLLAENYKRQVSWSFFAITKHTNLLEKENIFNAINHLHINSDKFIIVCFGVDFSGYLDAKIKGLKITENENRYTYQNIDVINFPTYPDQRVERTFFILKKADLPIIEYNQVENNSVYNLDELDPKTHVSVSVVNLNENEMLRKEIENNSHSPIDLKKSVLVHVELNASIKWKEKVNCICLKEYSLFWDRGAPNNIKEIREWNEIFPEKV